VYIVIRGFKPTELKGGNNMLSEKIQTLTTNNEELLIAVKKLQKQMVINKIAIRRMLKIDADLKELETTPIVETAKELTQEEQAELDKYNENRID
jgi:hypothetical protein